jgi:hypothetical protein
MCAIYGENLGIVIACQREGYSRQKRIALSQHRRRGSEQKKWRDNELPHRYVSLTEERSRRCLGAASRQSAQLKQGIAGPRR